MRALDIIIKKRDGEELSSEELEFLTAGCASGEIPDYQMAAWAMAVFFQGMSAAETAALTLAMLRSGTVIDLSGIPGPFVDKHSTGGVGDKTSLILAPLAAALGIRDPMISGRALGHTGGTLDKLESIPGYRTNLSAGEFLEITGKCGFAMMGQTKDIVPADRLLYALRDVTGTVESIPLITASILSKKAAEGVEALVLDVKCGSGAFMKRTEDAELLALSLADTWAAMGKRLAVLITDMDEPLGSMVGNFLELEECLDCMEGKAGGDSADLMELTLSLASRMAVLGGRAAYPEEGRRLCEECLAGGEPLRRFLDNVRSQGGDVEKLLELRGKYRSQFRGEVRAAVSGYVSRIDAGKVGRAGTLLGAGRNRTGDAVSPTAGARLHKKRGAKVSAGELVMSLWARDLEGLESALPLLGEAVEYSETAPPPRKLILKELRRKL
ncbi:MAG: thymidine phosphorylase [Treponema sp.]|jgi:pyrimidine-nucleoside phosphorylase|nr:thymidine phosphorylase [Treponema sp.]